MKDGEQIYHVDRVVRETNKTFGDGTHIVYVNGSYKDDSDSALGNLIHDFFCEDPADMKHRQLAERVAFLKDNKRGVRKMCKLMEDLMAEIYKEELAEGRAEAKAEGIAEGRAEGRAEGKAEAEKNTLLDNIRNLMETMKWTAKQAMDALKIPANKQKEYANLI